MQLITHTLNLHQHTVLHELHMGFAKIQQLAHQGLFPKNIAKCEHLICLACQFGKVHCQKVPSTAATIDAGNLHPGDCISCDQLESNTPGMIPTWKGKTQSNTTRQPQSSSIMLLGLYIYLYV